MALSDFAAKLPPLAAIVLGIRAALSEGVKELNRLAAETGNAGLRAQYLEAAAYFQKVLDSTDLAAIGLVAVEELKQALLTGRAPIRHDPTDLQ